MKNRVFATVAVTVLTLFLQVTASAQDSGQENGQGVDSSSGVARISFIHGDVSAQRGDSGDWTAVALNQPVVSSDKVSTGVRSRAEVQLDQANILRLSDNTLTTIANLSRTQIQVQVARGLVDYTVFKDTEANVEIDTANVAVHPLQRDGIYRVEVNAEGETQVIVRKGEAEISTPQGSTRLEKGRMIIVRGTADEAQYKEEEAPSRDTWDSWNNDRDRTIRDAQSWSHTNRYYVGSEDLDAYGRWVTVPDYGPVWSPVVSGGWAPYRSGRWVWEPGWGWTWVSYEPWGWAPYHYGRWFMYNSAWVWWPGPVYGYPRYRPVWAPAYVSFFGFGGGVGVGVGFGFGSVGWLPVGPCDRFYPWYGRYGSHFNSVNVVNITNITNIHNGPGHGFGGYAPLRSGNGYSNLRMAAMNQRVREGISAVPADRFGTGRQAPGSVSREQFRSGRMMAGNLPVVPTREALSVSNRPAAVGTMQRGVESQRFFSRSQPRPVPPSFDRQAAQVQQAIQRNGRFSPINATAGREASNAARSEAAGSLARPSPGVRMGASNEIRSGANSAVQSSERGAGSVGTRPVENQGWRRFGSTGGQALPGAQNQAPMRGTLASPANSSGRNNVERSPASDGAGWRRFSDSSSTRPGGGGAVTPRSAEGAAGTGSRVVRPETSVRPGSSPGEGGWRQFTPQSRGTTQDSPGGFSRESGASRGGSPEAMRPGTMRPDSMRQDSPRGYARPPLEMRQPIVMQRAPEGNAGASPSRGGYSGGHGNGGGHPQPSGGGGGGGPRGGSGGGSSSSHSGGSGHRR